MATTVETLQAYYAALPIVQYKSDPKFAGTLGLLLAGSDGAHGVLANAVYTQVRDGFDLKTAVGQQLDFLGELIGPPRYFEGLVVSDIFTAIPSYGDPNPGSYAGLSAYGLSQPPSWYTMSYDDFTDSTLADGDYRRVLQFLASVQSCDYAYATLDAILFKWFGNNVNLIVTGPMAITYQHLTSDPDGLFNIIAQMNLLPAPAGVAVTVQQVASF